MGVTMVEKVGIEPTQALLGPTVYKTGALTIELLLQTTKSSEQKPLQKVPCLRLSIYEDTGKHFGNDLLFDAYYARHGVRLPTFCERPAFQRVWWSVLDSNQ